MEMSSRRPYLIRATYEWILDNDCTPYVVVNATLKDVVVPQQFVEDGQIVLNVSPSAVRGLDIGNDFLTFDARFGGVPMDVFVPLYAVIGIYARENGEGLLFDEELPADPEPTPPKPELAVKRPSLKVVK